MIIVSLKSGSISLNAGAVGPTPNHWALLLLILSCLRLPGIHTLSTHSVSIINATKAHASHLHPPVRVDLETAKLLPR